MCNRIFSYQLLKWHLQTIGFSYIYLWRLKGNYQLHQSASIPQLKCSQLSFSMIGHPSLVTQVWGWWLRGVGKVTYNKWASSRQYLSSGFPTKRDSNQSPQLQRLARTLKFRLKQVEIWYLPVSEEQRRWSVCADAQAGLRLCCWQTPEDRFCHDEAQIVIC